MAAPAAAPAIPGSSSSKQASDRSRPSPAPSRGRPAPAQAAPGQIETLEMFQVPVASCKELTPTQRTKLQEAGVYQVQDLVVRHLPRAYTNWRQNTLIDGEDVVLTGDVLESKVFPSLKGKKLGMLKFLLSVTMDNSRSEDGSEGWCLSYGTDSAEHTVSVVKFMQGHYAAPMLLRLADKVPQGGKVVVKGRLSKADSGPAGWELKGTVDVMTPEEWEKKNTQESGSGELSPVYPSARPLNSKDMLKIMPRALKAIEASRCAEDPIPEAILQRHGLMPWMDALRALHMPTDRDTLEQARRRIAFQELFMVQLSLLFQRFSDTVSEETQKRIALPEVGLQMADVAKDCLPFELTGDQQKAVSEILSDLQGGMPMMRLLQGDVGSGKTAVAFLAMLAAASCGWQVALMAPTEVLAAQHKRNLDGLLERLKSSCSLAGGSVPSVALLTGSTRAAPRRQAVEGLADGSLQIVIGTHALIAGSVEFKRLGLAVVDEQHRFGVQQRSVLQRASTLPVHVLYLSATPIPRTLALVAFGEVDISAIRERPPGRTPVRTQVLEGTDASRKAAYDIIQRELSAGFRSYVICPLVETSEAEGFEELKAAEDEYQRLQEGGYLGGAACGLLHGRMSGDEKGRALRDFADGRTQVLITTSVVEVGVDVPEATVMIIEHAERFGLAQLHQLRGRIGRGHRASECVMLVGGSSSGKAMQRVQVLQDSEDGFEIAEADLQQRGPGDFIGTRQSGELNAISTTLQAARLPQDAELLEAAREEVKALLEPPQAEDKTGGGGGGSSVMPMRLWGAYQAHSLPELDIRSGSSILWNLPHGR